MLRRKFEESKIAEEHNKSVRGHCSNFIGYFCNSPKETIHLILGTKNRPLADLLHI